MLNNNLKNVLPSMTGPLKWIGVLAGFVSIAYTVKFNVGQAVAIDDKVLAALTGIAQDSAEIFFAVMGVAILSQWKSQSVAGRCAGFAMIALSVTLVLWSITATYGSNNAMIEGSVNKSKFEQMKLTNMQNALTANNDAVSEMNATASAMRAKAGEYSAKYKRRSLEGMAGAQKVSEKAAEIAQNSLSTIAEMNKIDGEAIGNVNTADSAFSKIAELLGVSKSSVSTTAIFARATQLEMICIFCFIAHGLLAPASEKREQKKAKPKDTGTRKSYTPKSAQNAVTASASQQTTKQPLSVGQTEIISTESSKQISPPFQGFTGAKSATSKTDSTTKTLSALSKSADSVGDESESLESAYQEFKDMLVYRDDPMFYNKDKSVKISDKCVPKVRELIIKNGGKQTMIKAKDTYVGWVKRAIKERVPKLRENTGIADRNNPRFYWTDAKTEVKKS